MHPIAKRTSLPVVNVVRNKDYLKDIMEKV